MLAFNNLARIVALSIVFASTGGSTSPTPPAENAATVSPISISPESTLPVVGGSTGPKEDPVVSAPISVVARAEEEAMAELLAALGGLSLAERELLDGLALEGREEAETEFIGPLLRIGAKLIPKVIKLAKPLFKSAVKGAVKGAKGAAKAAAADVVADAVDAVEYVQLQSN